MLIRVDMKKVVVMRVIVPPGKEDQFRRAWVYAWTVLRRVVTVPPWVRQTIKATEHSVRLTRLTAFREKIIMTVS